ncbi:MAG: hypothetical protein ACJAQ4_000933 [Cryomorphaceae bacterium]|jgi:hypothetical protein
MKTINQVLLALLFVAFSTVGLAQSQTTLPVSTVKLNDDIRFEDYDNDDDDGEITIITEERIYLKSLRPLNPSTERVYTGYSMCMPNRD